VVSAFIDLIQHDGRTMSADVDFALCLRVGGSK
jgi:hypothetical protein